MTRWLDIDPHGRVAPGSNEVRTALGDQAGRFEWLPSAPDLLVARRVPAAGGASPRPRILLCGDLAGFPIADFIGFAHQSRLTGVLHVVSTGSERAIAFKDGEVRSSRSSVTGERIGEVALRLGFITQAQLTQAMGEQRLMGKALVEHGFLTPDDLWKCFHEQITGVFHAILLLRSGSFWLLDDDRPDLSSAPRSVSTQALLMDGIRRIDELSLFRARIPGPAAFLRRRQPARPVTLQPVEQQLLGLVDGQRTVAQVAAAAHLGEFDATKVLYHLAEAGYLEATSESPGRTAAADRSRAVLAGMNEVFREVVRAVGAHGSTGPMLADAAAFLGDTSSRFFPLWRGVAPEPDGSLDENRMLVALAALADAEAARLDPRGERPRILLAALRELMFFYLFQAGERLPRDADEALTRTVKERLEVVEAQVAP